MKLTYFFPAVICYLLAMAPLTASANTTPVENTVTISSPDGKIELAVMSSDSLLQYSIRFNKISVIEPSPLGLVINGKGFGNSSIYKTERYVVNEQYPYRGIHSTAVNRFNGVRISLKATLANVTIDARVFNDGVAFRYVIDNYGEATVDRDNTAFMIPAGSAIWSQPNIKHYEGRYSKKNAEDFKQGDPIGPPATIFLPGNVACMAITEGGLVDFAGMSLVANGNRSFRANLDGTTKKTGKIESPWRIIEIGKDLNTLVNCDIIANVSPSYDPALFPKGYETDWVKPGRSVWSWLAKKRSVTLDNMKAFTDLAAQLGFEYNLVDEGWSDWSDSTRDAWAMMKELVTYSAQKNVKIWVWKAYPDRKGIPGIKDAGKRRDFFQRCQSMGIAGIKIDFFDAESQDIVNFYQGALKDAAEFKLMLNFHGANKPTGETRTWPNEMSREGIKGLEGRPPWGPANVTLPFTRYLAGHADFTPVHFGERMGEVTWSHHVATLAIFTSPFLCLGADPQSMLDNPALAMIKSIPATWDETIVLPQSNIGELAVYARRKGNTWFIAALNGTDKSKKIEVDLSFLKKGTYNLSSISDDKNIQANVLIENSRVSSKHTLSMMLNAAGGYVGRFERSK